MAGAEADETGKSQSMKPLNVYSRLSVTMKLTDTQVRDDSGSHILVTMVFKGIQGRDNSVPIHGHIHGIL